MLALLRELVLQHAEQATPFDINTALVWWTFVIFLILLAMLWRWGWPAILK